MIVKKISANCERGLGKLKKFSESLGNGSKIKWGLKIFLEWRDLNGGRKFLSRANTDRKSVV